MVLNLKVVECRKYCVLICLPSLTVIICTCKRNKYPTKVDMLNFAEKYLNILFFSIWQSALTKTLADLGSIIHEV